MAAAILAVIAACVSGLRTLSHDPGHKKKRVDQDALFSVTS